MISSISLLYNPQLMVYMSMRETIVAIIELK